MEFLLIASAHFLALLSPGPDFLLIMQASLRLPRKYGVAICAGIAAANGLYLLIAVTSLELMRELGWLLHILKYAGATYLVYLGYKLVSAPVRPIDRPDSSSFLGAHCLKQQFTIGFLSALLNPKNAIFYLSLFTVMVSDTTPLMTRSLYALWMTFIVFAWDTFIVMVIGRTSFKKRFGTKLFTLEKIAGTGLALFGITLPFM